MKKIILISAITATLFSCSESKTPSTEVLIESKNVASIQQRRDSLQTEILKLDEALSQLDNKKEEALVSVYPVIDTVFTHFIELQGNVDTHENILIQPQVPGVLVALNAKAGQRVGKGQVLGRIDDGGAGQQVAQLETQYALAKTTFERQKRLWDQKIGSEIQYLQAQTQMISMQKAVAQAKAQLSKFVIKAPFSGTIDQVFVEGGEVVSPGATGLMRIVNLSNMYVSAEVPETYIGKLRAGTKVAVVLGSLGKEYQGKIRQIANSINPNNRSFGIEVAVPNTENLLRPNQVAKLKISDYTSADATVIPSNVIQKDAENKTFVFVVSNVKESTGTAKKVMIKTGQTSDNVTEVLSGLSSGDLLITEGVNNVSEGMTVNF